MLSILTLAAIGYIIYTATKNIELDKENYLKYRLIQSYNMIDPAVGKQAKVSTLQDIIELMSTIKYKKDTGDETKLPEKTLNDGYGDCEDLSVLSASLLAYIGIEPSMLMMYNDSEIAHLVTYFYCPKENAYCVFDNNEFKKVFDIYHYINELGYDKYIYIGEKIKPLEVVQ